MLKKVKILNLIAEMYLKIILGFYDLKKIYRKYPNKSLNPLSMDESCNESSDDGKKVKKERRRKYLLYTNITWFIRY